MAGDVLTLSLRFHIHGGEGPCVVRSVKGVERVSTPFRYEVEFLAGGVDMDAARAAEAVLEITDASGAERSVHGVVEELSVRPTLWEEKNLYRAVIVPEASLLRYRHGYRVFQAMDVTEICTRVLSDAGLSGDRLDWRVSGRYESRDVCVQYDESEWDFISRLLEEEGIWYRFEHRPDGHTMVFADENRAAPYAEPNPLTFDPGHSELVGAHAYKVSGRQKLTEGRVSLGDYDGSHPSRDLGVTAVADGPIDREWYEYPGRYRTEPIGRRVAQIRLEERRQERQTFDLRTTAFQVNAGQQIVLAGAPISVPEGLVTAAEITIAREQETETSAEESGSWSVNNSLRVIPRAQTFRPMRVTPRPRVVGPQTAQVTGPAGQEIHVDDRGRVKVQFHWDRRAQLDDGSSCWIPVAHGHTTGAVMHPRVGWEVLVEFYEGDPDRPVVTGRVYNPFFPPPHALPERKTVSALRSDSLPGRERTQEIRFEDELGREHVAITAGRDLREVAVAERHVEVRNDENREIGGDRNEVVGILRQTRVIADQSDSVGGSREVSVGQDRIRQVRGAVADQVAGDLTIVAGDLQFAQVGADTPGQLQTMLRTLDRELAEALMDSLDPLLRRLRAAAEENVPDAGRAQSLLEGSASPPEVLGSQLADAAGSTGSLSPGSRASSPEQGGPQISSEALEPPITTASGLAAAGSSAGDAVGGFAEAASTVPGGPSAVSEGVPDLLPGIRSTNELAEGSPGVPGDASSEQSAGALGGLTSPPALGPTGLDEGTTRFPRDSDAHRHALAVNALPSIEALAAPKAALARGAAAALSRTARGANDASRLATPASELRDSPGLKILGALSNERNGIGTPRPESSEMSQPPGMGDVTGFWGRISEVAGDVEGALTTMAESAEKLSSAPDEVAEPTRPRRHEGELAPVEFAVAVADAVLRGALREEVEGEGEDAAADGEDDGAEGTGVWTLAVTGKLVERVAGTCVLGAGGAAQRGVGGDAREQIGMALLEEIGGGRVDQIGGSKTLTTGSYTLAASEGVTATITDTMRIAVDGDCAVTVAGAGTTTAQGTLTLAGAEVDLAGAQSITFECGGSRVSISADGICIEGTQIVVRGDTIGVDSPSMG
ncbi:MAG: type VI secretion system tip protein VgrG [Sandaracinaceae bacterium]|nr:MAG: type VI secretion system tip protein VgrG [Sandaracinaceae bacterium]